MSYSYGDQPTILPADAKLVAEVEYQSFAPCPCVCLKCCVNKFIRQRMYARVYENRFEVNTPYSLVCCCTRNENCVQDMIFVSYFDRQPTRSPMCCYCVPLNCCGPPVIFVHSPKCCCFDLSPYCGQHVKASPCSCCGLRAYCCCGNPCHVQYALPIIRGVKNGEEFLGNWKAALEAYKERHPHLDGQLANFEMISDNIMDFGGKKNIKAQEMDRNMA